MEIKKRIDISNQNRTDIVESIDDYYYNIFKSIKTQNTKINTESPGWVIDRMSILCLKIFHMREQIFRENVADEHLENCNKKLKILNTQQKDLSNSFDDLLEDYKLGIKVIKVYRQMKMYNDSSLNPELYRKTNH